MLANIWDFLLSLKPILITVSAVFGALTIIINLRLLKILPAKIAEVAEDIVSPQPETGGALKARWDEILRHIESPKEAEWKFAVIEADKLTEDVLNRAGFQGDSMGDKLTNIPSEQLETLQGLWEAHKIRNRLAHDINYFLRYAEAKRAVQLFEKTLKELQVL